MPDSDVRDPGRLLIRRATDDEQRDALRAAIKRKALDALAWRSANRPVPVQNETLLAGENMFFFCRACGWLADLKPEDYLFPVRPLCSECAGLEAEGWLPT